MKEPAQIVRMEPLPARLPEVIIYGKTKSQVAKLAGTGVRKGKYGSVSEVLHVGNGYAAKATLIPRKQKTRSPNEPIPMWARILVRIAWSLVGILVGIALLLAALSALIGSLVNLPWLTIAGGAAVVAILLFAFPVTRSAVTVIVKVFVH